MSEITVEGTILTRQRLKPERIKELSEIIMNSWEEKGIISKQGGNIQEYLKPIDKWAKEAKTEAEKYGITGSGGDDAVDAYRHAYTNAMLTYKCENWDLEENWDLKLVELLVGKGGIGLSGDMLEKLNQYKSGEMEYHLKLARNMDYWNNDVGREIGKNARCEEEIARLVYEAYKDGKLIAELSDSRIGHSYLSGLPDYLGGLISQFYRDFLDVMSFGIFRRPIYRRIDPLVLDLNGDGIKTISLSDSNASFDLDGDKFAEKTGWISKDDEILAIDRNNNGRIDDISEIFGNKDKANGFETLREFDSNKDGVVNANDTLFNQLKIWQDKNENGISEQGELMSLDEAKIKTINLNYGNTNTQNNGNVITQVSSFTMTDGSQGIAGDVDLQLNQVNTKYNGEFELDADVLFLPWLRGYGDMAALPIAVANRWKTRIT